MRVNQLNNIFFSNPALEAGFLFYGANYLIKVAQSGGKWWRMGG
jgi:hypothetical protein